MPNDDREASLRDAMFQGRPMYFNREGEPLTLLEWGRLFELPAYKIVRRDRIDGVLVSTVWVGVPGLSFRRVEEPTMGIFETMCFETDSMEQVDWLGDYEMKYASELEAIDTHELICAAVRERLNVG